MGSKVITENENGAKLIGREGGGARGPEWEWEGEGMMAWWYGRKKYDCQSTFKYHLRIMVMKLR